MANKTKCQTPGAMFTTCVCSHAVKCTVELPFKLDLSEKEARLLETNIHNAMELVLARYFPQN